MTERVLVIGAGMAGLWTALALAPTGREITLLERDPPPPKGDADEAFEHWTRRGVGHLRHSHAFLARLRLIIRDEHPELLGPCHWMFGLFLTVARRARADKIASRMLPSFGERHNVVHMERFLDRGAAPGALILLSS